MHGCINGWMDGWMGGWVDGWMDGWMDYTWLTDEYPLKSDCKQFTQIRTNKQMV